MSQGQTRVVVIWNRIIYPDASSIDLGSMPGADEGGYAGFHDQVNTHLWAKLGNAVLISIAAAGVQLSQPQAVNGQTTIANRSLPVRSGSSSASSARSMREQAWRSQTLSRSGPATGSWSWSTRKSF